MAQTKYSNRFKPGGAAWNKGRKGTDIGIEIGDTGTLISSGFISQQDYNSDLVGQKASKKFDEMRKSDATVRASLLAITLPILSANWFIKAASEDPFDEEVAEFVRLNLFNHMSIAWPDVLRQSLMNLAFGYMAFE